MLAWPDNLTNAFSNSIRLFDYLNTTTWILLPLPLLHACSSRRDPTTSRRYSANYIGWRFHQRIQFRLGVLAYRCLHNIAPAYLAESLQPTRDVDARRLRSADSMSLVEPATRCSTLGDRAFPVSAARSWNALPSGVRAAPSLTSFRQKLKHSTHTFYTIISWRVTGDGVFVQCPCNSLNCDSITPMTISSLVIIIILPLYYYYYTVVHKKQDTKLLSITSPNNDRFSLVHSAGNLQNLQ